MDTSTTSHHHVVEDFSHAGWTCYLNPCPHRSDVTEASGESECSFCGGFGWLEDEDATFQPDEGGVAECPVCEGTGVASPRQPTTKEECHEDQG